MAEVSNINIGKKQIQNSTGRLEFIDVLRIFATCAVVLLHTVTGIKDTTDMSVYPVQFRVFLILMDVTTWSVPIFIMISGYLFLSPERHLTYKKIIFKYCRRILLALFIFGVPYSCLELAVSEHSFNFDMILRAFVMVCRGESWSHMWYLYLVFFLYLITPALKWTLKRIPRQSIYIVLAFIYLFGSIFPFIKKWLGLTALIALPDEAIYIFYYLCGYLFVTHKEGNGYKDLYEGNNEKNNNKSAGISFIRRYAAPVIIVCMAVIRIAVPDSVQLPYNYPFTVLLSLAIFYGASVSGHDSGSIFESDSETCLNLKRHNRENIITSLSAICFTVYLIHPVFINIAYKLLHLSLLDFPLILSVPLFFIAVLGLSVPTAWAIRQIPVMKKYVL
jgi:surface polysaccharide O-acyltransferase-like enzyme